MTDADPFDLQRFVAAQEPVIAAALAELRAGHKRTHWMWFVFPQLRGLGRSSPATFYGIASLDEAHAHLAPRFSGRGSKPAPEPCSASRVGRCTRSSARPTASSSTPR